jgi:hypothetical protein
VAQAKFSNQSAVTGWTFLAQVGKQSAALADQQAQTAFAVQIMFMHFEVLGKLIDAMS